MPIGTPAGIKKSMRRRCDLRKASGSDCELQYFAGVDVVGLARAMTEAKERREAMEKGEGNADRNAN
jgi:hypothetical protein